MKHIIYKDLNLMINEDLNTVELIIDDQKVNEDETYINFIILLVEYAEHNKHQFVLLNKLNSDFKLRKELFDFTKMNIFKRIENAGVKNFIMIVKETVYDKIYKNISNEIPFMKSFKSREDAYKWIEDKKEIVE